MTAAAQKLIHRRAGGCEQEQVSTGRQEGETVQPTAASAPRLSALIVEDSPADAQLNVLALERAGWIVHHRCVQDREGMRRARSETHWDVVLCDHSAPGFDSFAALAVLRQAELELPLIVVSRSRRKRPHR